MSAAVTAILLVLATAAMAQARPYTFQWNPNTDGVTAGYYVYYGTAPGTYQPSSGVDVGGLSQFQVDLQPGRTYYFAVRGYSETDEMGAMSSELVFVVPPDSSISVSSGTVAPGGNVTASILNGPGGRYDWVGVYPVGSTASSRTNWKYLSGTQTAPATGLTSASLAFAMPTTPGQYNLRFFGNNSYTVIATSGTVTVASATSANPSVTANVSSTTVTAAVANGPRSRYDWVGLYPVAATSSPRSNWKYLSGTQSAPATGVASASVPFTKPTTPGNYHLRFFANDSYTLLATSATFTVASSSVTNPSAPSVTPSATSVAPGSTVTVAVGNGPGGRLDWVGLYSAGVTGKGYVDYKYLNGSQTPPSTGRTSATLSFRMPTTPGQYTFRFQANASFTLLAASVTVTVTGGTSAATGPPSITPSATSVMGGSIVTVAVANGPGGRLDWVALYPAGKNGKGYVAHQYLNGLQSPPSTGSRNATLSFRMPTTPGQYTFKFLANTSFSVIATSVTVTVTNSPVATVIPSATSVTAGGTLTVAVANGPGGRLDWVGLYPAGVTGKGYVDYKYLNGSQSPPNTGVTSRTLSFRMPTTRGQYVFRFLSNASFTQLATSVAVTVQ